MSDTMEPGFVDPLIVLVGPGNRALIGDDDISRNEYDASIDGFQDCRQMVNMS